MNEELRADLLAMQAADIAMRRELIDSGELYAPNAGYHPRMAEVHRHNNARMRQIIVQYGWPGQSLVGADGSEAAWKVVQHATLDPELQQQALVLLQVAVDKGEASAWQMAMLTDRVLMTQGEPQIYGSQYVGGEHGQIVPWQITDPDNVDARRLAVGLPPMTENTRRAQEEVAFGISKHREPR